MENEVAHIPFIALGHQFQLADRQSMHGWGKALVKTCFTTRGPILIYHRPSACHFGRRIQCRHQSTHGQKCISHTTTVSFSLKASGTSCEQGGEGVWPGEGRGGGAGKEEAGPAQRITNPSSPLQQTTGYGANLPRRAVGENL